MTEHKLNNLVNVTQIAIERLTNKKGMRCICWKIMLCLFFLPVYLSSGQTLDQYQNTYSGGMSARTLPGYSEWQSFTAGITGTLSQINMGFFNYINGSGTLKIFTGTGTGGVLKQTKLVNVFCASGSCLLSFIVSVPVIAGQVYTFQFIPGAGIPDPYGVQVQVPGTYSGGQMAIVDPSGTYPLSFDMVFQTYVSTTPLPVELVSFNGESINGRNHLHWKTVSEMNNDYFEVERSTDETVFKHLITVDGNGSITQEINYMATDETPCYGINYYRLKQVDFNGDFRYSKVIAINNNDDVKSVYIQATQNHGMYLVHLNQLKKGTLRLYTIDGGLLDEISLNETDSILNLDLRAYHSGLYLVSVFTNGEIINLKLLKN